jgi:hypothetical protein
MIAHILKFTSLDELNDHLQNSTHLIYSKLDIITNDSCYHLVYTFHNEYEREDLKRFVANRRSNGSTV